MVQFIYKNMGICVILLSYFNCKINILHFFIWFCRYLPLQSAKILLLPPKYEMIMVPSNHSFFQYCESNIGLFSIAPCKVITLNPLIILFCISFLLLFYGSLFKVIDIPTIAITLLFPNAFKSVKERHLLLSQ